MRKISTSTIIIITTFLMLAGSGTVSADQKSLCEHWYGDPHRTCGFAFYASSAPKFCRVVGSPHWLDRDFKVNDPTDWNDYAKNYYRKLRQVADDRDLCKCVVNYKCQWVEFDGPYTYWRYSDHKCKASPSQLGTLKYHRGRLDNCNN